MELEVIPDRWEGNEEAVKAVATLLADSLMAWTSDDPGRFITGVFHEMRKYLAEKNEWGARDMIPDLMV